MAFSEHAIVSITEIPALVATFALARGWSASGTTITRPGGGLAIAVTASDTGFDHYLQAAPTTVATTSSRFYSPKLKGTVATPEVSIPSKVYLFGASAPEPFIAIVVEYGINLYRHMYIGNLVKACDYVGGECVSAVQPFVSSSSIGYPSSYRSNNYLFAGRPNAIADAYAGGVRVEHANNPTTWRKFDTTKDTTTPMDSFDNTGVLGGFTDDVNDGFLARGKAPFAGAQILVPLNLYAPMPITDDTRFVPLGYPAGVRTVNMEDLTPNSTFLIGSQTWRCFPAMRKSSATSVVKDADGWADDESSYWVGYAYPQD